ncbi:MAG: DsbA family oxidoreductase [Sphingobium sp.]|nr:DsbA family oxidoreductase [Sphingobium sp.]
MPKAVTIDIVSDITCPWCAIGLRGLEEGLKRASDAVDATIRFHPFELNPDMPPEGRNMVEHLGERLGASPDQLAASRDTLKAKAAELDFVMAQGPESRIYNTFDAHRLLAWAQPSGKQHALERALFEAYFSQGQDLGDPDVLIAAAVKAGLDAEEARAVLESDRHADEVRQEEYLWQSRGIQGVPAFIFDGKYLVSGAQTPETFEQVLRKVAENAAKADR